MVMFSSENHKSVKLARQRMTDETGRVGQSYFFLVCFVCYKVRVRLKISDKVDYIFKYEYDGFLTSVVEN